MSSFSSFKKNSKAQADALVAQLQAQKSKSYEDDRFWTPTRDKTGNGYAVIRFLPATEGATLPWVQVWSHAFQGKGGWYIENCPTTLGLECPVCQANNELWNSGLDSDKDIARSRKRKLNYIANVYIISDPGNPDNNGKVKLFKFGKKIFDKLRSSMEPEFADEEAIDPFNLWTGRDFKLKVRIVEGYPNYDKSELSPSGTLCDFDDKKLEQIWNSQYKLEEFVDPSQFKDYAKLKERFVLVVNGSSKTESAEKVSIDNASTATQSKTPAKSGGFESMKPAASTKKQTAEASEAPFDATDDASETNSSLEFFKSLAEEE